MLEFYEKYKNKVTDKNRIEGCKIKLNERLLSRDIIMRQDKTWQEKNISMGRKIEREAFINKLLYISPSEREKAVRMAMINSEQIDLEVAFENYYQNVWLKNKKEK